MKRAAVSYIERADGRLLCVWNRRYKGWALPGGLVEPGETVERGQERELLEETGLWTRVAKPIYDGEHGIKIDASRGSHVHLFLVRPGGTPRPVEEACPITWLSRAEFLEASPFAPLYEKIFAIVPPTRTVFEHGDRAQCCAWARGTGNLMFRTVEGLLDEKIAGARTEAFEQMAGTPPAAWTMVSGTLCQDGPETYEAVTHCPWCGAELPKVML